MSRLKKGILEAVIILVLLAILLKLVEYWTGVNPIDNLIERKNALGSIQEVAAVLTKEVDGGTDGQVVMYIHDVSEEELRNINYIMSNLNGSVDSFQIHPSIFGVRRVMFNIVRSDNSYVYDAYKNDAPIPEDRVEAQRLLQVVYRVLKENVSSTMTEYQKELALHDYLVEHCEYSNGSPDNDNEFRAYGALVEGQAVCNGYAEAMALLLSCAGVENQYVVGTADNEGRGGSSSDGDTEHKENHAWNLVKVNGLWYHLDTTWDDPVGEQEVLSHAYFNMSDALMERDHTWDHEKYNKCDDMYWNYFHHENAYFENSADLDRYVTQKLTIQPYGTLECAIAMFEMNEFTLKGIANIPGISSVYYSTVGNVRFTVLTLYVKQ